MTVYRLTYGVEGVGSIEGTEGQLAEILDKYPPEVILEVLALEKIAGSRVYRVLLRYCALRLVEGFEG